MVYNQNDHLDKLYELFIDYACFGLGIQGECILLTGELLQSKKLSLDRFWQKMMNTSVPPFDIGIDVDCYEKVRLALISDENGVYCKDERQQQIKRRICTIVHPGEEVNGFFIPIEWCKHANLATYTKEKM